MGGLATPLKITHHRDGRRANKAAPLPGVSYFKSAERKDVEDMEDLRSGEIQRMPGEAREVFLSRLLLLILDELIGEGDAGPLTPVRKVLEDDIRKGIRKGRARPGGHV